MSVVRCIYNNRSRITKRIKSGDNPSRMQSRIDYVYLQRKFSESSNSNTINKSDKPQLPPLSLRNSNRKTLVLDLDETLVRSVFIKNGKIDFIFPVIFFNYRFILKNGSLIYM